MIYHRGSWSYVLLKNLKQKLEKVMYFAYIQSVKEKNNSKKTSLSR